MGVARWRRKLSGTGGESPRAQISRRKRARAQMATDCVDPCHLRPSLRVNLRNPTLRRHQDLRPSPRVNLSDPTLRRPEHLRPSPRANLTTNPDGSKQMVTIRPGHLTLFPQTRGFCWSRRRVGPAPTETLLKIPSGGSVPSVRNHGGGSRT